MFLFSYCHVYVYILCIRPLGHCHNNFNFYMRAVQTQRCPKIKNENEWNKWKNHFYEMKGDVGMSLHEKERNKKMPTPRHKVTHNPIPSSLFIQMISSTPPLSSSTQIICSYQPFPPTLAFTSHLSPPHTLYTVIV